MSICRTELSQAYKVRLAFDQLEEARRLPWLASEDAILGSLPVKDKYFRIEPRLLAAQMPQLHIKVVAEYYPIPPPTILVEDEGPEFRLDLGNKKTVKVSKKSEWTGITKTICLHQEDHDPYSLERLLSPFLWKMLKGICSEEIRGEALAVVFNEVLLELFFEVQKPLPIIKKVFPGTIEWIDDLHRRNKLTKYCCYKRKGRKSSVMLLRTNMFPMDVLTAKGKYDECGVGEIKFAKGEPVLDNESFFPVLTEFSTSEDSSKRKGFLDAKKGAEKVRKEKEKELEELEKRKKRLEEEIEHLRHL